MKIAFTPPDSHVVGDWALSYARAGLAVFPVRADKKPLTIRGFKDAVTNEEQIRAWWTSYQHADIGWAVPEGIVVVDLDVGSGADGLKDFFECVGVNPDDVETPQATTPRGGRHLVFDAGGQTYKNGVKLNGAAIDTRSLGGYIVLPCANNGRAWTKPLATPLAAAPVWLHPRRRSNSVTPSRPFAGETTVYAKTALERACAAIRSAPNGEQEATLNRESYSIGGLVGGGDLALETATAALLAAAKAMPAYREAWKGLEEKVRRAIADGAREPSVDAGAKPRAESPMP